MSLENVSTRELRVPPGPAERFAFTSDPAVACSPLNLLRQLFEQYGDVVRYSTRFNTFTLVNEPTWARQILGSHEFVRGPILKTILGNGLLAADGPFWERQRRAMLPEFRPARIEALVDLFREVTLEQCNRLFCSQSSTSHQNLNRAMDRIALSNIGRSFFGTEIHDSFLDAFGTVMRELGALGNAADFGLPLIRTPETNRTFNAAMKVVEDAVVEILRVNEARPDGILRLLQVQAHDQESPLSQRQLRDEIVTMITAGHETTAVSLSWVWYVLLSHPTICDMFYREFDQKLGGRPITAADVPRLVFTRKIIDETLRLYPPVWLVGRTALRHACVGDYDIPANTAVLVSPFILHRHPNFWSDPERFDPERFQDASAHDDGSYIPFLSGRHLCIGKYFALTEITVVLATLAQQFRFRLIDPGVREFEPLVSLRMRTPLTVEVCPRQGQATWN